MKSDQITKHDIDYSVSAYYKWTQDGHDSSPVCTFEKCRHVIVGYKLKEIPEFNEIQDKFAEKNYYEALLRQKTLIDTVSNVFFNSTSNLTGYLELRLANNILTKTVECYLLLRLIITSESSFYNPKRLQEEFKSMIPDEYFLEPLDQAKINRILALDNKSLVEIRKTTNYLPVGSFYQEESFGIAPRNLVEWDLRTRYHVPSVSYIEPKAYNLSNLYKVLQNVREPVQIRLSIGSVPVFEFEKNLASQYHNMVTRTYTSVANPEIMAYVNGFSKYISFSHLFSLKMQVAAGNEVASMSIANALCGQLYYGEIKTQTHLRCFSLKNYASEAKRLDWEECNHQFYEHDYEKYSGGNWNDIDGTIRSFILRMPYLSDSSEAMAVFRLPIASASGLPGIVTKPIKPFYQPNLKAKASGELLDLGSVITSANSEHVIPYTLPLSDLTKHGLIVGATGSGKTNTALNFVKQLIKKDIPFLIIEPLRAEYYNKLLPLFEEKNEKLYRFNLNNPRLANDTANPEFLRFNPFIPQPGITMFQHLSYIKSCFMAAFPMYGTMPLIFEDCLYEYFRGEKDGDDDVESSDLSVTGFKEDDFFNPEKTIGYWMNKKLPDGNIVTENNSFRTVLSFSNTTPQYFKDNEKLFDGKILAEIESSLSRRFIKLTKGLLGQVLCPENWCERGRNSSFIPDNIDTMLHKSCIIELEGLPENEDKALIMAFILSYLFENRKTRLSHSKNNQLHVTVIEEAHRLLRSSSVKPTERPEGPLLSQDGASKTINVFIDMLAELGAKNEAIFIVEQSPAKLVADAIKNTNLKIMHRLTNKGDRGYLGEAMNMDEQQSRYATTLQQGEALVFEEQLDKPILVKMNNFNQQ